MKRKQVELTFYCEGELISGDDLENIRYYGTRLKENNNGDCFLKLLAKHSYPLNEQCTLIGFRKRKDLDSFLETVRNIYENDNI